MLNRWQRTIVDLRGNVVPYVQLQILREQTQSAPTIYRDKAGTEVIPNAIVTANQNGYAYFYAPADLYRIRSTQPSIDWRDVDLGSAAAQQLAQQALDNAVPTYETLSNMQADTSQPVPTLGRVVNDSTLENNGYYVWTGAAWERAAYQYLSEMDVSIEPAPSKIPRATGDGVIREAWVEDLPFNYDQIYAQIWSARYPGIPAPSFYQEFGGGASLLNPRITFSRSGEATYIKNGKLLTAGVDEPVFENGGLRVWPSVTNYVLNNTDFDDNGNNSNLSFETIQDGFVGSAVKITALADGGSEVNPNGTAYPDGSGYSDKPNILRGALVKKTGSFLRVVVGTSSSSASTVFDSHSGAFLQVGSNVLGHGAVSVGEWWWVWSVTVPVSSSSVQMRIWFSSGDGYTTAVAGDELIVSYVYFGYDRSEYPLLVKTDNEITTRAADNARIEGAAFSSIFNPNQGALVLPHSSFGEGNIITLGGLQVARTEDGLELNNTAIPDTEDAKQNLKLRWGSNGLDVFVGNTKALHDIPLPSGWGDADSLVLADNDSIGKYIDRLAMLTEAPTDEQMEVM